MARRGMVPQLLQPRFDGAKTNKKGSYLPPTYLEALDIPTRGTRLQREQLGYSDIDAEQPIAKTCECGKHGDHAAPLSNRMQLHRPTRGKMRHSSRGFDHSRACSACIAFRPHLFSNTFRRESGGPLCGQTAHSQNRRCRDVPIFKPSLSNFCVGIGEAGCFTTKFPVPQIIHTCLLACTWR